MTKDNKKTSNVLKEVREPKYRQKVFKDRKKESKKNPPKDNSFD